MRRLVAGTFVLLFAGPAPAQAERYEFARRLRAFEAAWEKADAAGRKRAVGVHRAVGPFSHGHLGEAARVLDREAFSLRSDVGPSAARQWGWSLSAFPETRAVDGAAKELAVTIKPFYPVAGDIPKNLELQLWFTNRDVVTVKPAKFPLTVKVPLPPLGEARGLDRKLYFLADVGKDLRAAAVGVSQVADLRPRLARLEAATAGAADTIERATARARAGLLRAALDPTAESPPTDLPYADLLANAEAMLDGKPFFTPGRHGQFWLSVPVGGGDAVPCRVHVPKGLTKDRPAPVVVALHGFGGDENTFFEHAGAGRLLSECEKRGWVLVAPRLAKDGGGPPVAPLVATLADRYPLDRKRVFVLGQDLGADRALAQVPGGSFAALALLGGSGHVGIKVEKSDALAKLPTFLGSGTGNRHQVESVRSLNRLLTEAGAADVTYKEMPGADHFLLARVALDDVLALFDRAAGK